VKQSSKECILFELKNTFIGLLRQVFSELEVHPHCSHPYLAQAVLKLKGAEESNPSPGPAYRE
jgi:hypothetical protein